VFLYFPLFVAGILIKQTPENTAYYRYAPVVLPILLFVSAYYYAFEGVRDLDAAYLATIPIIFTWFALTTTLLVFSLLMQFVAVHSKIRAPLIEYVSCASYVFYLFHIPVLIFTGTFVLFWVQSPILKDMILLLVVVGTLVVSHSVATTYDRSVQRFRQFA